MVIWNSHSGVLGQHSTLMERKMFFFFFFSKHSHFSFHHCSLEVPLSMAKLGSFLVKAWLNIESGGHKIMIQQFFLKKITI